MYFDSDFCFSRKIKSITFMFFEIVEIEKNFFWNVMCFENSFERLKFSIWYNVKNWFESIVNFSVNSFSNKNLISFVLLFSFIILTALTKKFEFEKFVAFDVDCADCIKSEHFDDNLTFSFLSSNWMILIWFLYFFYCVFCAEFEKICFRKLFFSSALSVSLHSKQFYSKSAFDSIVKFSFRSKFVFNSKIAQCQHFAMMNQTTIDDDFLSDRSKKLKIATLNVCFF